MKVSEIIEFKNKKIEKLNLEKELTEQEFLSIVGKRNYKRWWNFTHLRFPMFKLN